MFEPLKLIPHTTFIITTLHCPLAPLACVAGLGAGSAAAGEENRAELRHGEYCQWGEAGDWGTLISSVIISGITAGL